MMSEIEWYTNRPEFQSKLLVLKAYIEGIKGDFEFEASYASKRGAMVVDVVASRQRQYGTRVLKIVDGWTASVAAPTLKELSNNPPDKKLFGLREGESESISRVANGLLQFGVDFGLKDEDVICEKWARAVEDFRFAPKLDPYVGHVDGMGIALFAYLRKLSGADAIKPDVRVRQRLQSMGFEVPDGAQALMMLSEILADQLQISKSKFDSYLWRNYQD
jgi:hypothetical protein